MAWTCCPAPILCVLRGMAQPSDFVRAGAKSNPNANRPPRPDRVRRGDFPTGVNIVQRRLCGGFGMETSDKGNGYEEVANLFMSERDPLTGASTVRQWSRTLAPGSTILELGCGHGVPISQVLI